MKAKVPALLPVMARFGGFRRFSPWTFTWRITLEGLAATLAVALVLGLVFPSWNRETPEDLAVFAIDAILIAPILETLLFQTLPIALARKLRARFTLQLLASVIPFAAIHFLYGPNAGIAAGLIGGFYFAYTYARWRKRSLWTALWTTGVSHSLHNLIVLSIGAIFGGL